MDAKTLEPPTLPANIAARLLHEFECIDPDDPCLPDQVGMCSACKFRPRVERILREREAQHAERIAALEAGIESLVRDEVISASRARELHGWTPERQREFRRQCAAECEREVKDALRTREHNILDGELALALDAYKLAGEGERRDDVLMKVGPKLKAGEGESDGE